MRENLPDILFIIDLIVIILLWCAAGDIFIFELPIWIISLIFLYIVGSVFYFMIIEIATNNDSSKPLIYIGVMCASFLGFMFFPVGSYFDNTMIIYSENGKYGIKSKHTLHIFAESIYDTVYSRNIVSDVLRYIDVEYHDTTIKQSSNLVFFLEKDNKFGIVTYNEIIAQPVFDSIKIIPKCYEENACYDVFKCYADSSIKTIDYTGNKPSDTLYVKEIFAPSSALDYYP
jgi:hypothetical protein